MTVASFSDQLASCESCPRKCKVDRLAGKTGYCRMSAGIQVSHAGLHFGEEPPLSGTGGSGTIFFTGCNLRCVFCQNYRISQEYRPGESQILTADGLAVQMLRLQAQGAHNINFVSPSHVIFQMADAIVAARRQGLTIPVVYNSNGYDSVDALRQIGGLVEIYLPDIKYLDNTLAKRYSDVDDYAGIVPGVLAEMLHQVGNLEVDENGIAIRGVIVRHLVLPGLLENSRKCLEFLARLSPEICVNIMAQYTPHYKAYRYPEIDRGLRREEYAAVLEYARELGLRNVLA